MGATDTGNVTGPVTTPVAKASSSLIRNRSRSAASVCAMSACRSTPMLAKRSLLTAARHTEGLLSDSEIKSKWALSGEDWAGLGGEYRCLGPFALSVSPRP